MLSPLYDEQLVRLARRGDLTAYDELVRRYRSALLFVIQPIVGSREAAEDIAQETFLIAYRALFQLREEERFAAWISAIARRRARRALKQNRPCEQSLNDQITLPLLQKSQALHPNPEVALLRKEADGYLRELLSELPEGYLPILQLYYYEQWSVAQIAEFLSLTQTTVKWRLHAGRKALYRRLKTETETNP